VAQVPGLVGAAAVAFGLGIATGAGELFALQFLLLPLALFEFSRLRQRIALVIGHALTLPPPPVSLFRRFLAYPRRAVAHLRGRHLHDAHTQPGDITLTKRPLIAAVAVLGIALAGCGSSKTTTSSSSASATSSASPTTASSSSATATSSAAGGGASGFKAAFVADRAQFRTLGNNLGKSLNQAGSKTDAQLATEFQDLSNRAKAQAGKLSQLSPPAKLKPAVDRLVNGLNTVADKLQKIATDANNHNAASAKADTIKLVQQAAQVKAADVQISNALNLPSSS
jgi:hypothetical protein